MAVLAMLSMGELSCEDVLGSACEVDIVDDALEHDDDAMHLTFFLWAVPIVFVMGTLLAIGAAKFQRKYLLKAVRDGHVVVAPQGACLLCCCGPAVVYYWEGMSWNFLLGLFIWPCMPLCCWCRTPAPVEHGVFVQPSSLNTHSVQPKDICGSPVQVAMLGSSSARSGGDVPIVDAHPVPPKSNTAEAPIVGSPVVGNPIVGVPVHESNKSSQ